MVKTGGPQTLTEYVLKAASGLLTLLITILLAVNGFIASEVIKNGQRLSNIEGFLFKGPQGVVASEEREVMWEKE